MLNIPVLDNPKYAYLVHKQPIFFRLWKNLFYIYCRFVFSWYVPVTIFGREKIPNASAIFCSNHNSHMDVALVSTAAGKSFNHFGMLAAKDYWFDNSFKRILINLVMNLIPIARRSTKNKDTFPFSDTITISKAFMELGKRNLVIFPEGSRGKPNEIKPFRKGAARFSTELNAPIVPVFIHGSGNSWPKGNLFMKPTRIQINILDPMYPSEFDHHSDPVTAFTNELESRIKNAGHTIHG
ncbi:MAG: 1-acyl-sn-glycerol-3-phosphate acyltransferase [Candidatus Marinimicrobia bacterium]|jgi:long-chain acyl-CoA synthetase|nr:1-acyl-sn-glycerol-3-phosphate acyltransferase [Candidatus Neomarinimicrobiota bacterium]MBT3618655.1 1-acyl-sn-glycerol-3-phosphate acyltransferase [Candidatus Neomarinimicrobiota bacterium]MBT3829686.1 1-acyl-sn-glycerol-3-phosphate acyltransferase [Candidatus Neomarinimicrobiota bacterium]MBT3997404.1 1-acyl-sn-glycerol-3-phosphate acyltransferase [Candidatus Neomarinimicrobiota bacterium]MBT4280460.1 1-acyl-sn-glycerol-3-phosphate acyltransferase [Candidatus Neomarinimicrobiota bacterium